MKWKPAVLADFTNFTYTMLVYILTMLLNCFHWLSNILVLGLFYGFLGGLLQEDHITIGISLFFMIFQLTLINILTIFSSIAHLVSIHVYCFCYQF